MRGPVSSRSRHAVSRRGASFVLGGAPCSMSDSGDTLLCSQTSPTSAESRLETSSSDCRWTAVESRIGCGRRSCPALLDPSRHAFGSDAIKRPPVWKNRRPSQGRKRPCGQRQRDYRKVPPNTRRISFKSDPKIKNHRFECCLVDRSHGSNGMLSRCDVFQLLSL